MEAADTLLAARRTLTPIPGLPLELVPADLGEVYFVQDRVGQAYGAIGGWKVGAPSLEATPIAAPMPAAWIGPTNTTVGGGRLRGVEAEVAFLLGEDLPPRAKPYSRDEIAGAIASCHPAIEVLESGLADPVDPALRMSQLADLQMHGGFLFGPACADWKRIDFSREHVTLSIDAVVRHEATGSNTSGDLLRLLPWLAGEGAFRTGGLRAGQWITTGSWTGATFAAQHSVVHVHFGQLGSVGLVFG